MNGPTTQRKIQFCEFDWNEETLKRVERFVLPPDHELVKKWKKKVLLIQPKKNAVKGEVK